jgi:hypothetical protein
MAFSKQGDIYEPWDSRGYLLPKYKRTLRQITEDHNIAALMVKNGELAKDAAVNHPASSRLTRFVGMNAPALPEYYVCEVAPGDRIFYAVTVSTAWSAKRISPAPCAAAAARKPSAPG